MVDGIQFASSLEAYMYNALKMFKIKADYEGQTFTLIDEFKFEHEAYERCANGRGDFKNRGGKRKWQYDQCPLRTSAPQN